MFYLFKHVVFGCNILARLCWHEDFSMLGWLKQIPLLPWIKLIAFSLFSLDQVAKHIFCLKQISWKRSVVVAERSSALDLSSGVVRMWVRIPAWPFAALVSLSKTLNHNCFVLRMGRKAVGPVCCVMHVQKTRTLTMKEKGLAPVFLDSCLEHPAGWICVRYKSSVLLLRLVNVT